MFVQMRYGVKEEKFLNNCILVAVLDYEFSRNQETLDLPWNCESRISKRHSCIITTNFRILLLLWLKKKIIFTAGESRHNISSVAVTNGNVDLNCKCINPLSNGRPLHTQLKVRSWGRCGFGLTLPLPHLINSPERTAKTILEGFMFALLLLVLRAASIFQHCEECSHHLESLVHYFFNFGKFFFLFWRLYLVVEFGSWLEVWQHMHVQNI